MKSHDSRNLGGRKAACFIVKLYKMMEQTTDTEALSWTDDDAGIIIRDVVRFENDVLPHHFKTSKFASFQRQLNLHGFCKVVIDQE